MALKNNEIEKVLLDRGYDVKTEIGHGPYSIVGRYNNLNKARGDVNDAVPAKVAIKIIDRKKASKRFIQRFLPRELELSRLVKHKHLIEHYDCWHVGDRTFLVMELAERGDLEQFISRRGAFQEGPGPRDKPRVFFRQLLDAVQYLHTKVGIVHRDLKCDNIFLTRHLTPKIGDFGFARKMTDTDLSETFCGSKAYVSPEVWRRTAYQGREVDMWSLGVILFIMLEAHMPFDDRNIPQMIRHQEKKRIPYSKRNVSSPVARELIEHLLEPETSKRYDCDSTIGHQWLNYTPLVRSSDSAISIPTISAPSITSVSSQPQIEPILS